MVEVINLDTSQKKKFQRTMEWVILNHGYTSTLQPKNSYSHFFIIYFFTFPLVY
jgi:hypothetical protein